jgi:putative transcriptional regulator
MERKRQLLDVFGNLNSQLHRVVPMIRIHLSRLMGDHNEKIIDLLRATGLARNTVTGLYRESSVRMDLDTLNVICRHYGCSVGELLEYTADDDSAAVLT